MPYQKARSTSALMAERKRVGSRVACARRESGLSHEDLAEEVRLSPLGLRFLENGQRRIDEKLLSKIAELTGKPVEYFSTGVYPCHSRPRTNYPKHL